MIVCELRHSTGHNSVVGRIMNQRDTEDVGRKIPNLSGL